MDPVADLCCVLKLNPQCDSCKMKTMNILSSINGVYSVTVDGVEGIVKISGEVDPIILLRALGGFGKHAEVVWVKLKHPVLNRTNYDVSYPSYDYGAYAANYGQYYGGRRPLGDYSLYDTCTHCPVRRTPMAVPPYYTYGRGPAARYMSAGYDPYLDGPSRVCSIM